MRIATLLYHDILAASEDPDASGFAGAGAGVYKLSDAVFDTHLNAISARLGGVVPVRATDLVARRPAPAIPWVLTFDDGGASALRGADQLAARGWVGHFFITAGRIGEASFLDAAGVRRLAANGHVIGSHSWSHPPRMSALPYTAIREEWERSLAVLQDILGASVATASVPGGFYSRAVARGAAECGIAVLFNSEPVLRGRDVNGCLVLGRFSMRRDTTARHAAACAAGSPVARWPAWLGWNSRKLIKRVVGGRYERGREELLRRRLQRRDGNPVGPPS